MNIKDNLIIKDTGKYGNGVFATKDIKEGEIIYELSGEIISFDESIRRIRIGEERQDDSLQVGLELDMDLDEFSRTFNHSCDPSAGIRKISELVALRDIKEGEEITFDYSATIGPNIPPELWTMECGCDSLKCRKILGNVLSIPKEQFEFYKSKGVLQDYILEELNKITKDGKIVLPDYKKIIL